VIKNQVDKDFQPVELGYDQRSGNLYDNKDFLLNCVNYLLDDTGLINIRSKELDLPLLDKEKVYENYTYSSPHYWSTYFSFDFWVLIYLL
jgi:hypothetical protein